MAASISAFAQWLMGFGRTWLTWLYNSIVDLINAGIVGFCSFAVSVAGLFPAGTAMPILPANTSDTGFYSQILNTMNWLFPVGFFVQLFVWVLVGVIAYFAIAPLARWLKLLT